MIVLITREQGIEKKNKKQEEDIANLCLMANNNEVNLENSSNFIFDELYEVFNDLMDKYKKLRLKNKELKSLNISLSKEKNKILMKKDDLLKEKNVR